MLVIGLCETAGVEDGAIGELGPLPPQPPWPKTNAHTQTMTPGVETYLIHTLQENHTTPTDCYFQAI